MMLRTFAVAALLLGLACSKSTASPPPAAQSGNIAITANEKGFVPSSVALKKGEKSSLTFTRVSDQTCATEVLFPDLNIKKPLPLNTPVTIDIPAEAARTLTFSCGMQMFKGSVVIQ